MHASSSKTYFSIVSTINVLALINENIVEGIEKRESFIASQAANIDN